jgi:ATP-binding cassette, subfamily B, bacterial
LTATVTDNSPLPARWKTTVSQHLTAGEGIVAWLELDLDQRLNFAESLLVLTNRQLLTVTQQGLTNDPIEAGLRLQLSDEKSVAQLELVDQRQKHRGWYFTTGKHAAASRFITKYEAVQAGEQLQEAATVCPSCGAIVTSEDGTCAACAPTAAPPVMSSLIRLLEFARPRKSAILMGLGFTLTATVAGLAPPLISMKLVDEILKKWEFKSDDSLIPVFWLCIFGLVVCALLAWLLNWGRAYILAWVSERISADMRSRTYAHLQQLSLEFFGGKRTGDLMSRISSDSDRICNFLSLNLIDFVTDMLMVALTAIILVWLNPLLALVTLAPFPIIVWLTYIVRTRLRRGFRQSGVAWSEMTSVLADTIPGIRVVKAFAQEKREVERFDMANQRVLDTNDRVNLIWSFFSPLVSLLTEIGMLIVWGFGAWLIYSTGDMAFDDPAKFKLGALVAATAYVQRFYSKTEGLIMMVAATQRAAAAAHRIFEILDRVPSVPEPAKPVSADNITGHLQLKDVRFKYGTREVLHGLNLTIEPGEMIGLVGPSGAGKSTLINLICRFYDVSEGAILVDGVDTRSYPVAGYRQNIGIVLQDPFLFFGTIAENIAYGRPNATRQEIIRAARLANAHEFILRLQDGYDSLVGERGQSLSGGERQRISIARALLIDPRILILDEATSAVDTETEQQIQTALDTLIAGRTTIAIAHRLSTLRKANRLVVLEKGNIVEIGTHAELIELQGAYHALHKAQQDMVRELGV